MESVLQDEAEETAETAETAEIAAITTPRDAWCDLGEKFAQIQSKIETQEEKQLTRRRPANDAALLTGLFFWCDCATWVNTPLLVEFGWWFLERFPVEKWTPDLAAQYWQVWQMGREGSTEVAA